MEQDSKRRLGQKKKKKKKTIKCLQYLVYLPPVVRGSDFEGLISRKKFVNAKQAKRAPRKIFKINLYSSGKGKDDKIRDNKFVLE